MSSAAMLDATDSDIIGSLSTRYPMRSLVASARRITSKTIRKTGGIGSAQAWQEDAWDMYDLVGEQRFLVTTLANRLSQARFFVGRLPDDTTEDIEKILTGPAYDVFDSMAGKSDFKQMIGRLGQSLFLPGDGYLLGCPKTL